MSKRNRKRIKEIFKELEGTESKEYCDETPFVDFQRINLKEELTKRMKLKKLEKEGKKLKVKIA